MKFDLSNYPSLCAGHERMIQDHVDMYAKCRTVYLLEVVSENKKYMYIDDYPGLRGESQIKVCAARYVLTSRGIENA